MEDDDFPDAERTAPVDGVGRPAAEWTLDSAPAAEQPGVAEPGRPAAREGASVRVLALGVVVAVAVGFGILLVAGGFGAWGVLGAALLEAACVYLLYRLSPSY